MFLNDLFLIHMNSIAISHVSGNGNKIDFQNDGNRMGL